LPASWGSTTAYQQLKYLIIANCSITGNIQANSDEPTDLQPTTLSCAPGDTMPYCTP